MTKEEAKCYLELWLIACNEGLCTEECYDLAIKLIDQYFYEEWKNTGWYKNYKARQ